MDEVTPLEQLRGNMTARSMAGVLQVTALPALGTVRAWKIPQGTE